MVASRSHSMACCTPTHLTFWLTCLPSHPPARPPAARPPAAAVAGVSPRRRQQSRCDTYCARSRARRWRLWPRSMRGSGLNRWVVRLWQGCQGAPAQQCNKPELQVALGGCNVCSAEVIWPPLRRLRSSTLRTRRGRGAIWAGSGETRWSKLLRTPPLHLM